MNRRDLVQKIVLGGGVILLVPSVLESCSKSSANSPGGNTNPTTITLDLTQAGNSALNTDGGSIIVQNILVANIGSSRYIALSSICTHQGCTVAYISGAGNIQCPCHGSVYSTSGTVIAGPAPAALKSYAISKSGNILTLTL